jgi:hypothetical protein
VNSYEDLVEYLIGLGNEAARCKEEQVQRGFLPFIGAFSCAALRCAALHCTALHCTALHCTALHCTAAVRKLPPIGVDLSWRGFELICQLYRIDNLLLCVAACRQEPDSLAALQ